MGANGLLRIEEIAMGRELHRHQFPRGIAGRVAMSLDGSLFAVASGPSTNRLCVWKWQATEEPRELPAPRMGGRYLAFSLDGKQLAESGDDAVVRLWDVTAGQVVHKLEAPGTDRFRYSALAFLSDGRTLMASGQGNTVATAQFWDVTTGKHLRQIAPGGGGLVLSPDEKLIAGLGGRGMLRVWDLASGKDLSAIDDAHTGEVSRIAATGNAVITASDDNTIRVWDAATGQQRHKVTHGQWIRGVALSPDGSKLASSSLDNTVRVWEVATGNVIYTLLGHGRTGRRAVGLTADGKTLLSWGDDLQLRKWDMATGKLLSEMMLRPTGLRIPEGDANNAQREMLMLSLCDGVFSADGTRFVQCVGRQYHVFDTASGQDLFQLANKGYLVISLAVSSGLPLGVDVGPAA
jgi:WD40 repeat protein